MCRDSTHNIVILEGISCKGTNGVSGKMYALIKILVGQESQNITPPATCESAGPPRIPVHNTGISLARNTLRGLCTAAAASEVQNNHLGVHEQPYSPRHVWD